jgi:hypothetical protein
MINHESNERAKNFRDHSWSHLSQARGSMAANQMTGQCQLHGIEVEHLSNFITKN